MTISTTTNRVTYTGNGVTVAFSFPYAFFAKADLVVIETVIATGVQTTKTLTTHYTIAGSVDALGHYSSGGTVTAVTAPASTVTWTIYRDPTATQTTDLVENDPMPAESLEAALDYQTMLNQRTRDIAARCLQQPEGDSATIDRLPAKVDRASLYLAFDVDGDPVATAGTTSNYVVTPFMETVLDDTTAANARATLAAAGSGLATGSGLTMATARLLGRATASTGAVEEISVGASLTLSSGSLSGTAASDTQAGVIEIAVQAEVEAGSDTTRAVTPGRQHYHPSAAKAWVKFTGTGTIAIGGSYNVASLTDNGTGDYTITFTTALADANYSLVGACSYNPNPTTAAPVIDIHTLALGSARIVATRYIDGVVDVTTATATMFR